MPIAARASSSPSPHVAAGHGDLPVRLERFDRPARPVQRRAQRRARPRHARPRSATPSSSAVRSGVTASSKASAAVAAAAARRLYSTARSGPSSGAAAAKWWARSARPRGVVGRRCSRAPRPTRRCSSARRSAAEPVVERAAHQLVREPVAQRARRHLLDHAAAHGLLERRRSVGARRRRRRAQHVELELGPGDGRQLEQVAGRRVEPRQPLAHHLAHALGRRQLGQRPGQARDPSPTSTARRSRPARATARTSGTRCPR